MRRKGATVMRWLPDVVSRCKDGLTSIAKSGPAHYFLPVTYRLLGQGLQVFNSRTRERDH